MAGASAAAALAKASGAAVANGRCLAAAPGVVVAAALGPCAAQRRWYTPPSRRTWSKQHYRIRTPRPMVDRFDLSREQVQKQWWRERPVAPATFFGFPDISKHDLRGGSLYVEQMDSVTLAVLADKCVKDKIIDPEIWEKFSWRAQQISTRCHEPDLCYIFRAFSRADWFDQNLLTTYLGRLHRRLTFMHLPDAAVMLEAFANPRFRQSDYLQKTLVHIGLLLQHRDDAKADDLARCCAALRKLRPLSRALSAEVTEVMYLLAESLLLRDLSDLGAARAIVVIDSFAAWGLLDVEGDRKLNQSLDLCWALVRDLQGKLRAHGREKPDDLAALAYALGRGHLDHDDLWKELVTNLEFEAHRLSGKAVAMAALGAAKAQRTTGKLYEVLIRRLAEEKHTLTALDCARAVGGFSRGPASVAEQAITGGPVAARMLEIGMNNFAVEELVASLDGLSRVRDGVYGVELLASVLLEALDPYMNELNAGQLATIARSLGYLRPDSKEVLSSILKRAQVAVTSVSPSEGSEDARRPTGPSSKLLCMFCQGVAAQPKDLLPNGAEMLQAVLPALNVALSTKPSVITASMLVASLLRCPPSEQRNSVLDTCSKRLLDKGHDLSAPALVSLSGVLARWVAAPGGWQPPQPLTSKVAELLDMKRYDLRPGVLWRAADALTALGVEPLRLEERDARRGGT